MTRSGARLLLASTAASCLAFLLFFPRAIAPSELPALVLDPRASAAACARDARAGGAEAERARAADRGEEALRAALSADEPPRSPEAAVAAGYGLVREGRMIAPRVVVRAVLKAQWNQSHGLGASDGLEPIERQAYFGWLALEAPDTPPPLREEALAAYGEAGGAGYEEALAFLHAILGHHGDAFLRYAALFRETGELRYRNHARWAALAMD